ncbi:PepSY domain-containing protein [Gammaproteobacteria bacterium LSUCC0057]|uniref:PepSY domain-containing protein n=1 Tax=Gammaproteobacteria bacterium LSUCC0057 TaxID=2559237 RepID=A0A4Y8UH53_9GAMM|nr:PepSY domain-containing protein [Gammaproteobacteria bacterium LSUCC0057]
MKSQTIKWWARLHSVSSLICTAFLLMLALTGLPLIFEDEIDGWLNPAAPMNVVGGEPLTLDQLLAAAKRSGEQPVYMSFDSDRPVVNVTTAAIDDPADMHFASYNRYSGELVEESNRGGPLLEFILSLHTDMFLGLPGMLLLGAMGMLFAVAVISGLVLYAPFMRRLPFATLRSGHSVRVRRLDSHNLLGVMATAWLLVVSLSGVVNTLETPLLAQWRSEQLASWQVMEQPTAAEVSAINLDRAVTEAVASRPDLTLQFIAFAGSKFATQAHHAVYLHGNTPLTARIITPILIDSRSGALLPTESLPWYMTALALSRPLHFGDYGGFPLKLLWAALDLVAIAVLWTGLRLWWSRRREQHSHSPTASERV